MLWTICSATILSQYNISTSSLYCKYSFISDVVLYNTGSWSSWTSSACSATCGRGLITMKRECRDSRCFGKLPSCPGQSVKRHVCSSGLNKLPYCKPRNFGWQFVCSNFGMAFEVPKLNLYLNFVKVVKLLRANSNVCQHGKLLQLLSNYVALHIYYGVAQLHKCSSSVLCIQPGVSSFRGVLTENRCY